MNNSADWQHEFDTYIEANELPDGGATDFYQTCVKPFIEALLSNFDERFPEDALDAADVFDPINVASCASPESRYKYGSSEVLILAEHFGLETTTVLTEWKEFNTTLLQFMNAQQVMMSPIKHQEVLP